LPEQEKQDVARNTGEQFSAVMDKITESIVAVTQGQARLEQAMFAEREVTRDPKTGRALGVRIKKAST
jgi:hypothetical protein